jgi:hypothetical protein
MSKAVNALEGLDQNMTSLCQSWVNVKLETLKYNKSGQKRARMTMEQVSASEDSDNGSQEVVSVASGSSEDDGAEAEYEDESEESDESSVGTTELEVTAAVAKCCGGCHC